MFGRGRGGKGGGRGGGGDGAVYVGNLSWETSWQSLKDHFRSAGEVTHADVMTEPNGRSKGCGLVSFAIRASTVASAISRISSSVRSWIGCGVKTRAVGCPRAVAWVSAPDAAVVG